jgi:hypothetical protein
MSSASSKPAQIARRLGYFIGTGDVSGYAFSTIVEDSAYNGWTFASGTSVTTLVTVCAANGILQDMGETAKVSGNLLRKVRVVSQNPSGVATGGGVTNFWIVMPGGEYPVQGVSSAGSFAVAKVARLG